jgi:hypothetical protein
LEDYFIQVLQLKITFMGQETIAQVGQHFNFINLKELITLVDLAED